MSQTATITTHEPASASDSRPIELQRLGSKTGARVDGDGAGSERQQSLDDVPPPHAQGEAERWNKPIGNVGRLAFAFLSFIIAGMNDAAIGVRCPLPRLRLDD